MKKLFTTMMVFCLVYVAYGQTTVTGTVIDESGETVIGATILLKGTTRGTISDLDGSYSIKVPNEDATLVASFTGYKTIEEKVGNRTEINFQMESDISLIDEVVITGYGSQGRKVLTSAISSLDAKEIENLPTPAVDQMIQGRAPGVQISANSGTPGGSIFVRIRGTNSITAGSDPLYVVDGIPIVSTPLEAEGTGGQRTSPIADINPADIQSIDVLKDAAATAIYGARAANGVVLITTKRGATSRKARITLNAYTGIQNFWRDPSEALVNATQFEELSNEAARNRGQDEPYPNPGSGDNTDWNKFIFQDNAPISNLDLSISGGDDKVKYYVSGNSFSQDGIMRNNDYQRQTGRVNLDYSVSEKLRFGTSVLYSRSDRTRSDNDNNIFGALGAAFFNPPNLPARQSDGSLTKFSIFENPIAVAEFQDLKMKTNRVLANVFAEWDITDYLTFKTSGGVDYNNIKEDAYWPTQMNEGAAVNGQGRSTVTVDDNLVWENVLTFQKGLGGEHYLTVLLGQSIQTSDFERTVAFGQQFPSNDFRRVTSAAIQTSSSSGSEWGIASYFGRINYDFAGKYLVNVNMRRDGSSRFGEENRWGTFPSIGVGWRISEESFMANNSFFDELKLRGSWGVTGNQNGIGNFASLGLWDGGFNYAGAPGTSFSQLANPDLKWETTTQFNVGVDMTIFKERLSLTFDYYSKLTEDLLLNVPLPRTTGFTSQIQNFGELENKGWEFGINYAAIQTNDLQWNVNFNISQNEAVATRLVAPIESFTRSPIRLEEGLPLFSFWLHEQLGVDPQTGDAIWRVGDSDSRTEDFNPSVHRYIVGDAQPDFIGGITSDLTWKGINFMMFWQYSIGNDQLHWNRFFQEHGGGRNTQYHTSQLDRWQQPGDQTMVPRQTAANYSGSLRPSRFLEDGSYLRLKNVSLGYSLPSSIIEKVGMSGARIYISAQNLITITDYTGLDPELNTGASNQLVQGIELYAFPQARTFTAGFTANF
ncbi:MAG: TonB-dependent receptor [Saprospiraceae bacterium]